MTPDTEAARVAGIAAGLTAGAKRACRRMTADWQFCGKASFDANGAHALHWAKTGLGRGALAEREVQKDGKWSRYAYRLTPLGLRVRQHLQDHPDAL
jgi:hypothetical protein